MIFLENWILSSLRDENTFISPRGGLVRLFGLPWGFTPNLCPSHQKKIRTRRTPFIEKIERRNLEKSTFSKKILKKF